MIKYISIVFVAFYISVNFCIGQIIDERVQFSLAQQYEELQEWERALEMYLQLYKASPQNYLYFSGLQRSYTQLKKYDEAIELTNEWLKTRPNEIPVKISQASLYYLSGRNKSADSLWNAILTESQGNVAVYRLVAQEMMQHRLYDEAIATYHKARVISNNSVLFTDEIAQLYFALQQYQKGIEEYILWLQNKPDNYSFIQSRLQSIVSRSALLSSIQSTVKKALSESDSNIGLLRLLVWIQLELKEPYKAFETTLRIDQLSKASGAELLKFAQRLLQEQSLYAAVFAFTKYLELYPNQPLAEFGLAEAHYALSKLTDPFTQTFENPAHIQTVPPASVQPSTYNEALRWYKQSLSHAPSADIAQRAWYSCGIIYYEHFQQYDSAIIAFRQATSIARNALALQSFQKMGEVYLTSGNFDEALRLFTELTQSDIKYTARYWLAKLEFYRGNFDSALSYLKPVTEQLTTEMANEALQLQLFIQENIHLPDALKQYGQALFLVQQRNYIQAIPKVMVLIDQYPQAFFKDDAYMLLGELFTRIQKPIEAIETYRTLADSIQLSIWKDKALWNIATIYERILNNTELAIRTYEVLLIRFPHSLYAEESRKRIRLLRGDVQRIQ